jgi:hypothetical protein
MKTTLTLAGSDWVMVVIFTMTPHECQRFCMELFKVRKDTAIFRIFSGKVIDDITRSQVFANVYLIGSSLGTVTNAEGNS